MAAQYGVRVGKSRELIPVERVEDASDVCDTLRKKLDVGASGFPRLTVVEFATGRTVAHVSYNGRVWNPDNVTPFSVAAIGGAS
jgi:hypothetical protein